MKRLVLVAAMFALCTALPAQALAHHVGGAEDAMPADQWLYVDSVAHGAGASGNMDMETAPGDEVGMESMGGNTNWEVAGQARMNTP